MPVFTLPLLGLAAAVAVPALAGIYWLRNRYQRHSVSSLMLWVDHRSPREGGVRRQRLQTPLLFFLELLAVALLVLAATGPRLLSDQAASPLLVVLDDSYSMLAAGPGSRSARDRGRGAVLDAIDAEGSGASVRLIRAGDEPQLMGATIRDAAQARAALKGWTAQAPRAAIGEAVSLASELGGPRARILVVTDHAPPDDFDQGAAQWWAFGSETSNLGIVTAVRATADLGHRCLIEVANFADAAKTTRITVRADGAAQPVQEQVITVEPDQPHRRVFTVPRETGALTVTIGDDALALDNRAVLLPPDERPVRVQTAIRDAALRRVIHRALRSTGRAELAGATGQLLVTDSNQPVLTGPGKWVVRVRAVSREAARAYVGPFVLDRSHPLCEGLNLGGVVWAAGADAADAADEGAPVIMAGNTPLVSDRPRPGGRHDIVLRLNPALSSLTRTVNWPVLWWNLVRWRAAELPGLQQVNIRLGTTTQLIVDDAARLTVHNPVTGEDIAMTATDRRVVLRGDAVGVWNVRDGEQEYQLAVNALNHDESNLAAAETGRWGRWVDDPAIREAYADASWAVLLLALGVLGGHLWLVFRSSRGGPSA